MPHTSRHELHYNLKYETTVIGFDLGSVLSLSPKYIQGDACVKIKNTEDGKNIYLDLSDSGSSIAWKNSFEDFDPITILKNMTVVLPLFQNILLGANQSQIDQEIGKHVELPPVLGMKLLDIQSTKNSLIFYSDLKE